MFIQVFVYIFVTGAVSLFVCLFFFVVFFEKVTFIVCVCPKLLKCGDIIVRVYSKRRERETDCV